MGRENWDTGAFWFPTRDRNGLFLAVFLLLFALHFDEIFGLHASDALVLGAFPVEYVYQLGKGVVHVGFMYVLYRYWPEPPENVTDGGGER